MSLYKPFPSAPEPADFRRINKSIKRLIGEYLPTLSLNDRKGKQRLAVMKFKAALKVAIKADVELNDRRSLTVDVHYTVASVKASKPKHYWAVTVGYDRRSVFRELTVMLPVETVY